MKWKVCLVDCKWAAASRPFGNSIDSKVEMFLIRASIRQQGNMCVILQQIIVLRPVLLTRSLNSPLSCLASS